MNEGGLIGLSNGACTITNTSVSVDVYGSNAGGFVGINKNQLYSILIIEDEKNILDFMARTLRSNGYKTITSETGQSGLSIINSHCPDLILLDLGLPDMDGNDIISSVRKWTSCPIIVISARAGEQDKVAALDLGADDYITKPFGTSELLARIRTSLRHSNRMASNSPLFIRPYKCQGLMLDFEKLRAICILRHQ